MNDGITRRPLATAEEVAAYLGVPVRTLYQWRLRGTGPRASKVGRHLRYRWSEVERWLDEQATKRKVA
ncbi:MAG TPA: helix-turn-helix domain-containing protein [Micromonosporaceae bacterium]|nr:helix-turn-helix domain-containing protein [Micromonosporaceae bacterium]